MTSPASRSKDAPSEVGHNCNKLQFKGSAERGGDSLSSAYQACSAGDKLSPPREADLDAALAVGVRPSSGAAGTGLASALGDSRPPRLADVAAPEDGRTPTAERRCALGVVAACAALASAAGFILFCFDPRQYHFYPVCFFHRTTGLLCPGCGALRGLHQLLHGHLAAAFRFNPMLVASLPFLAWFGARYGLRQARNQSPSLGVRPAWMWLTLAAVLVVSVLRNLPGAPFAMLRP